MPPIDVTDIAEDHGSDGSPSTELDVRPKAHPCSDYEPMSRLVSRANVLHRPTLTSDYRLTSRHHEVLTDEKAPKLPIRVKHAVTGNTSDHDAKNFRNFAKINKVLQMSLTSGKLPKDPNPPLTPKKFSRNGDSNPRIKFREKYNLRMTNADLEKGKKSLRTPQIERSEKVHLKRNMTAVKLRSAQIESHANTSTKHSLQESYLPTKTLTSVNEGRRTEHQGRE